MTGSKNKAVLSRAKGCLLGQIAGDSLGSLVEFRSPEEIKRLYPDGVRELAEGGAWGTIAGQPTDDSEMALALARTLVKEGKYDQEKARGAYLFWLESGPFDRGMTITRGLLGNHDYTSQANGAMMRISPLGIFGVNHELNEVAERARQDAAITHPNPVCVQANVLYTMAISHAIRTGCGPHELYDEIVGWARTMDTDEKLSEAVRRAAEEPPEDYTRQRGWVLIAFHNALWQLVHARNLKEGVVDTVMHGGDTDTNAAICGALLGAVYGKRAIPAQWLNAILDCRPFDGIEHIKHPRPECFWPNDAPELAEKLVSMALR
jgi:ADP-ribosyl-[dinitrogen reductase] hydrolase